MPKTMTFDRQQLEIVRKLLRTELKRAQTIVDKKQARLAAEGGVGFVLNLDVEYRDRVAALLQEAQLPVMVTRRNLMTGAEYQEAEDTPLSCSPASETYWSM